MVIGDITDKTTVANITEKIDVVWHLAAVVSSAAEADFDLGMDVNLYGLLNLLEELRKNKQCLESFCEWLRCIWWSITRSCNR